jgi:hypothetical protein
MNTPDKDIRMALAAQIEIAAPLAIVWPRWVLGADPADWAGVMRSENDGGKVHGYSMSRRSSSSVGEMSAHVSTESRYVVVAVHYYLVGDDATNSEDIFKAEIDAIRAQLALHDPSALAVSNHNELQVTVEGIQQAGAEKLHWAWLELTVMSC